MMPQECYVTAGTAPFVYKRNMRLVRNLGVAALIVVIALGTGCKKKRPKLPPLAPPPIISEPLPPAETQPQPAPTTTTPQKTETAPVTTAPKPKPRKAHKAPKKTAPVTSASKPSAQKPGGKTVTEGSTASEGNVQISAEVPNSAASQQRQATENLLQASEANLRKITRTLNDNEQAMFRQVRNFITQSRLATQDGDLERAYNLATKANLLSQELAK